MSLQQGLQHKGYEDSPPVCPILILNGLDSDKIRVNTFNTDCEMLVCGLTTEAVLKTETR